MKLADYLASLPPENDEYWDDQIWDMTVEMDLRDGTFGSLPPDVDAEKYIAYYLRETEWGEEVWAKLRKEKPELFTKSIIKN